MEILNQFGFDLRLFIAQIVNFLIIAYIFKRFLYKPLFSVIKKRDEIIKQGVKDSEKARKTLEDALVKKDEILRETTAEAAKILATSKEQAVIEREEMLTKTKDEIQRMLQQTREQISLERETFKKDSQNLSLEIARKILESTINSLFDKKENDTLIKKGLQKIKNA